ncbi:response regulator [Limisalsivibrio acetivorans]|uniref:response regulator n=1 Tax=Limisalsivibrio acetivorans TaxID=1304888 RepID=UPI0003B494BA|nr:response regulator [Limisalsivibrio acetivorans]
MEKDITVFVIDDEMEILKMLENHLKKSGFKNVRTFSNPLDGLKSYNGSNADIVLLDIMMPQMDGIEVLDKLKEKNKDLRVVMMTAYSTLDRVLKSHKIGADSYVLKPFKSLKDVSSKIEEVLAEK